MSAQCLEALAVANETRTNTKAVRLEIAAGVLTIADALTDPRAQAMPVGRLLCAQPHWGQVKVNRLLNRHGIWSTRRVRELTARQRQIISDATA